MSSSSSRERQRRQQEDVQRRGIAAGMLALPADPGGPGRGRRAGQLACLAGWQAGQRTPPCS
jgi:hypothetical protein